MYIKNLRLCCYIKANATVELRLKTIYNPERQR